MELLFELCWRVFELLKDFIVWLFRRWFGTIVGGCGMAGCSVVGESIEADAIRTALVKLCVPDAKFDLNFVFFLVIGVLILD